MVVIKGPTKPPARATLRTPKSKPLGETTNAGNFGSLRRKLPKTLRGRPHIPTLKEPPCPSLTRTLTKHPPTAGALVLEDEENARPYHPLTTRRGGSEGQSTSTDESNAVWTPLSSVQGHTHGASPELPQDEAYEHDLKSSTWSLRRSMNKPSATSGLSDCPSWVDKLRDELTAANDHHYTHTAEHPTRQKVGTDEPWLIDHDLQSRIRSKLTENARRNGIMEVLKGMKSVKWDPAIVACGPITSSHPRDSKTTAGPQINTKPDPNAKQPTDRIVQRLINLKKIDRRLFEELLEQLNKIESDSDLDSDLQTKTKSITKQEGASNPPLKSTEFTSTPTTAEAGAVFARADEHIHPIRQTRGSIQRSTEYALTTATAEVGIGHARADELLHPIRQPRGPVPWSKGFLSARPKTGSCPGKAQTNENPHLVHQSRRCRQSDGRYEVASNTISRKKLNPLAPEFRNPATLKAKIVPIETGQQLPSLAIPRKRPHLRDSEDNTSQEPIWVKTKERLLAAKRQDNYITQSDSKDSVGDELLPAPPVNTQASVLLAIPIFDPSLPVIDLMTRLTPNDGGPGRVAQALTPEWAEMRLKSFMEKYPLTGTLRDAPIVQAPVLPARAVPASNPAAAEIQQQLEIILLEKKERKAYERLSDTCIDD